MTAIGYARVSTSDQSLAAQLDALRAAGCDLIRQETASGSSVRDRHELQTLLAFLREGDELVVTRIDRLARSVVDLQTIVLDLTSRGVTLRATEQPFDTSSATGKLFLDMLGAFAEFETKLRRERQMEGIANAKARGAYKGRKRAVDRDRVRQLHAQGLGPSAIAREIGASRSTVYRVLGGSS